MAEGIFLCSALFLGLLLPFLWTDVQGGLHRGPCPGLPLGSASQGSDPGLPGAGGAEELPLTQMKGQTRPPAAGYTLATKLLSRSGAREHLLVLCVKGRPHLHTEKGLQGPGCLRKTVGHYHL